MAFDDTLTDCTPAPVMRPRATSQQLVARRASGGATRSVELPADFAEGGGEEVAAEGTYQVASAKGEGRKEEGLKTEQRSTSVVDMLSAKLTGK